MPSDAPVTTATRPLKSMTVIGCAGESNRAAGQVHEAAFSSGADEAVPKSGLIIRLDGTSFMTTLATATTQLSPTLTPGMMMLCAPI